MNVKLLGCYLLFSVNSGRHNKSPTAFIILLDFKHASATSVDSSSLLRTSACVLSLNLPPNYRIEFFVRTTENEGTKIIRRPCIQENKQSKRGKGKAHPRTVHEGPEWEYRYSYTPSFTSALDRGGWSTPRPGRFTPEKDPVPIVQDAG